MIAYQETLVEKDGNDIVCQILDWYPYDETIIEPDSEQDIEDFDHTDNKNYMIRVFGKDEDGRSISIKIKCGKGTYIRSLARDIAHLLKTEGYVEKLVIQY